MAENSKIQWTHHTFNPWRGCTKVSSGCANCYAHTLSGRNPGTLGVWGPNGTRVVASEAMWREPSKWDKAAIAARAAWQADGGHPDRKPERPRVFCASLADVFEDWQGAMVGHKGEPLHWPHDSWNEPRQFIPDSECGGGEPAVTMFDVRRRLFRLIDATPNLDWLLLTKRPENIQRMTPRKSGCPRDQTMPDPTRFNVERDWVRPNVWLGTSVENQAAADERIPHLLKVPAAVRFLSMEPLLGPVDLTTLWMGDRSGHWNCLDDRLTAKAATDAGQEFWVRTEKPITGTVNWVIVGGESGNGARPFNTQWARDIRNQCETASVPFFLKQFGERPVATGQLGGGTWPTIPLALLDKKGGDPAEWPWDLRVREFPAAVAG